MNGAEHQAHRRLLMPPFRKEQLPAYHDPLVSLVEQVAGGSRPGVAVDMWVQMKGLALQVTTRLLFGVDDLSLGHAIETLFEEWLDLNHVVSFAAVFPADPPEGCYERLLDVAERLEARLLELAERRRQAGPGGDLLGILLAAQDAGVIGPLEVVGQMITLFNAAYHTTTAALTWNLFLLAQHPRVMRDLYDELHGTLGGGAPSFEQLGRLALLERVIKEGLRLLPPVVYLPRITSGPVRLGPYELPGQTVVLASPYVTHHLPEIFPEPQRYEPDRWLLMGPCPSAYVPFGGGARLCLGAPFSTLLLKVALSVILQRYRLMVVPGALIERQGTLSLNAKHGVPMYVFEQDEQFTASWVVGNIHEMVDLPEGKAARAA
jgi:cytochrome P450